MFHNLARENPVNRIRSSPGQTCGKLSWTLVRRAECDRVRIPLLSVILSPGSRSDILRGKTRIATATSRINAYRGLRSLLHKPFAAKCYCNTQARALQGFFVKKLEFFWHFSLFCSKAPPADFSAPRGAKSPLRPWPEGAASVFFQK